MWPAQCEDRNRPLTAVFSRRQVVVLCSPKIYKGVHVRKRWAFEILKVLNLIFLWGRFVYDRCELGSFLSICLKGKDRNLQQQNPIFWREVESLVSHLFSTWRSTGFCSPNFCLLCTWLFSVAFSVSKKLKPLKCMWGKKAEGWSDFSHSALPPFPAVSPQVTCICFFLKRTDYE